MGIIIVPTHTKWKALKKKYGVPAGAVSGVDVGKALDACEASQKGGAAHVKENIASLEKLEKVLNTYISKLDKKKVKEYPKFQKEFLDDYLGAVHSKAADFKRYQADIETYKKEVVSFMGSVQQLKPKATTADDLQKFRSGPLRGFGAVGSGLRGGYDTGPIDAILAKLQQAIDDHGAGDDATREKVRAAISKGAEMIGAHAKRTGLI